MKYNFSLSAVLLFCLAGCCVLFSCKATNKIAGAQSGYPSFFTAGHRGTRGLMPENTIPAMTKCLEAGANTIEMDVHITRDGQVLVYHDASFNPDYTTMPDGSDIPKEQRKAYTFYQMNYAQVRPFIIGAKPYAAYPQQQRLASYTPLLSELIDSVENYTKAHSLARAYYLIEVKSNEKTDGFEQPAPEEYMNILMDVLRPKKLGSRLIIQSFDMRPLQVLHRRYPEVKLGFLTADKKKSLEENIKALGFTPAFYNPIDNLVTPELVRQCHAAKMLIEPWVVNTAAAMKTFKNMGVDGIITDYPNLFKEM